MCIRDRVETDDTFSYKLCHGSDSMKTHYQLSICICRKLLPFVTDLLLRAKEKGEIHLNDPETAASFCLYGQLGILLPVSYTHLDVYKRQTWSSSYMDTLTRANALSASPAAI